MMVVGGRSDHVLSTAGPGGSGADGDVGSPGGGDMRDRAAQLHELERHFSEEERRRLRPSLPGFNAESPPLELPPYISGSILSDVLLGDPSLYTDHRHAVTRGGVSFAQCIKPGIDLTPQVAAKLEAQASRRFDSGDCPPPCFTFRCLQRPSSTARSERALVARQSNLPFSCASQPLPTT
jgi:hypothetical protein